jgi:hypothetical protein
MPISVVQEPAAETRFFGATRESCCFCRTPTLFWVAPVTGESVACCQPCAGTHEPKDLPTKKKWCESERASRK